MNVQFHEVRHRRTTKLATISIAYIYSNMKIKILYTFTLLLFHSQEYLCISIHPLLIIVSFDGFRYDYLNKTDTPNFAKLAAGGVRAPWIEPRFITKTFPNHFSIATGLHEESHGIVANKFYDPDLNDTFWIGRTESKWWDTGAVPLWVGNQLTASDRYSGGMMWSGTDARIKNMTTYHLRKYSRALSWHSRVDEVIKWLTDKDAPANCVFMYFEQPDSAGHSYGPNSPEVIEQIRRADNVTGYLIQKLLEVDLYDKVNLIITSDHGMLEIPNANIINGSSIVDPSLYTAVGGSPVWGILPNQGQEDEVYMKFLNASAFNNFMVYKKEDIPEVYHYRNNRRIMPILIVANENWDIEFGEGDELVGTTVHGSHGHNNSIPNMRPIFIGHGPDFKKGYLSKPFRNIDIYPLACHLLGITPSSNNGSMENVEDLLQYPPTTSIDNLALIIVGALLGACVVAAAFAVIGLRRRSKKHVFRQEVPMEAGRSNSGNAGEAVDSEENQHLMSPPRSDDS